MSPFFMRSWATSEAALPYIPAPAPRGSISETLSSAAASAAGQSSRRTAHVWECSAFASNDGFPIRRANRTASSLIAAALGSPPSPRNTPIAPYARARA